MGAGGPQHGTGASHPFPVLIMDYDGVMRRMLSEVLTLEIYDVALATRGIECLDYLARHRQPHILMFQQLFAPEGDVGLLRYVRGNPPLRRRLGILVYGMKNNLATHAHMIAPFAEATLELPFDVDTLIEVVSRVEGGLIARRARASG
jgi:CheY-like chemotaxis protein